MKIKTAIFVFTRRLKNNKKIVFAFLSLALIPVIFLASFAAGSLRESMDLRQEAATNKSPLVATLSLKSQQTSYKIGEEVEVDIKLNTGGTPVYAGQVRIGYNKKRLQVLGVVPGKDISQSPAMLTEILVNNVKEEEGTVFLDQGTGLPSGLPYQNQNASTPGIYGRLKVKAILAGKVTLYFKYANTPRYGTQAKGDTDVLTLLDGSPADILVSSSNLKLTFTSEEVEKETKLEACEINSCQEDGIGKDSLDKNFKSVSFTPTLSGRLEKVAIKAGGFGVGTRSVFCKITDKNNRDLTPEARSSTFSGQTPDWREVNFSTPLDIVAGTSYKIACRGSEAWSGVFWVLDWTKGKTYRTFICH